MKATAIRSHITLCVTHITAHYCAMKASHYLNINTPVTGIEHALAYSTMKATELSKQAQNKKNGTIATLPPNVNCPPKDSDQGRRVLVKEASKRPRVTLKELV